MFWVLVYSEHCKLAHGGDFVRRVILLHKNETITSPCVGDSLIPFELSGLGCNVGSNSRQVLVDEDLRETGVAELPELRAKGGQSALGTM